MSCRLHYYFHRYILGFLLFYATTICRNNHVFQLSCLSLMVIIRFMACKIFPYGISCMQNLMHIISFSFMYVRYRNNNTRFFVLYQVSMILIIPDSLFCIDFWGWVFIFQFLVSNYLLNSGVNLKPIAHL
jgi:hypothetical protein